MAERIGLFGGSFNPVHVGHLVVAQDVLEQMGLHRVIFLPAAQPPHKMAQPLAPASVRLEMLRLATADDSRFEVSSDEIDRGGVSYTVDTLRRFRDRYPDAALYFLIGGDTLLELHTWREIGAVLELAEIVTVGRPGISLDSIDAKTLKLPDPWPARLAANIVAGHRMEISSTDIRNRCVRGWSIRYLVPAAVERYIVSHRIYF
ncbi:MAG: nicotinate-nucleotide adenylyltransferase [Kiritimatiellae bacterium]|nr:nicotinate-nucleotide adenylyltransferase [Kiritimatiellia bacterium]MCO5062033.1 nicotinate-nucleotide adenylyltransferase [Kiritimatiellia bacterium]MCO5069276.1 nicotinate-nucleotide adenylyltransferase [Kiritimatiellia bacterium]MCO6401638.1 nicotinate-nucleotide adenylyltransferase [Verrucomicrobiota bacterium]